MRKILRRAVCPVQSCPIIWCGAPPEHPKPNAPNPVRPNGKLLIHRRVTGTFKILMRSSILEEVNVRKLTSPANALVRLEQEFQATGLGELVKVDVKHT